MGIDIKLPIGMMFTILGVLLTIYGLITNGNQLLYTRSMQVNVNLWSGLGMLVFGSVMLILAIRERKSKKE